MHRNISILDRRWGLLLVASALGVAACSNDTADPADGGDDAASGGSTGGAGTATDDGSSGSTDLDSSGGGAGDAALAGGSNGVAAGQGGGTAGPSGAGTSGISPTTGGASEVGGDSGAGGAVSMTGGSASAGTGGTSLATGGSGEATSGGSDSGGGGASSAGGPASGGAGLNAGGSGGETPQGSGGESQIPGDAVPSSGCDAATPPATGRYSIDVGSTEREYILKLPEEHDGARPYPLIFAWHGGQYSADWVDSGDPPQSGPYYGIESEADGNAIFVAPQALSSSWTNEGGRDIAFVDAILARLETELCIDLSRIFSTGFSMGGIMTLTIGCERGDVFRAIAPMSGRLTGGCPDSDRSVAYWSSHGNADTTILPEQGEAARDEFVRLNHCDETTTPVEPSGCVSYDGCDPGYPAVFCTFDGVHEPAPFAGEKIWDFLSQF